MKCQVCGINGVSFYFISNSDCTEDASNTAKSEIDEVMQKRRELHAQMRMAAENEEYEKAAQLRDELKTLESNNLEN